MKTSKSLRTPLEFVIEVTVIENPSAYDYLTRHHEAVMGLTRGNNLTAKLVTTMIHTKPTYKAYDPAWGTCCGVKARHKALPTLETIGTVSHQGDLLYSSFVQWLISCFCFVYNSITSKVR